MMARINVNRVFQMLKPNLTIWCHKIVKKIKLQKVPKSHYIKKNVEKQCLKFHLKT